MREKIYINFSAFDLTCWDTDGKNTSIAIGLTEEQARKVCDVIGLIGFAVEQENDEVVAYYRENV